MLDANGHSTLLRLMAWLSPTFPVGSFTYSHGLERAVHDGLVDGRGGLNDWIEALLVHGSAWNDAVLFAESWRRGAVGDDVAPVAELAEAMAGSRERHMESTLQGEAFMTAAAAWGAGAGALPYCVAVGSTAGRHGVPLEAALGAWLQAFASNQLQAAIRLSVIGQTDAVGLLAALEPLILGTVARAARSTLDDLGSCTVAAEIAAMKHETQYSRLFRS
jgi:urease accessory protein